MITSQNGASIFSKKKQTLLKDTKKENLIYKRKNDTSVVLLLNCLKIMHNTNLGNKHLFFIWLRRVYIRLNNGFMYLVNVKHTIDVVSIGIM